MLDGPFTESKELIGGWALMECRDQDEAIEWTKRFLTIAGAGECRIRQVYLRPAFPRRRGPALLRWPSAGRRPAAGRHGSPGLAAGFAQAAGGWCDRMS